MGLVCPGGREVGDTLDFALESKESFGALLTDGPGTSRLTDGPGTDGPGTSRSLSAELTGLRGPSKRDDRAFLCQWRAMRFTSDVWGSSRLP